MMSAFECFQNAAKCEEMARDAGQRERAMLLDAAKHWRTLGEHAKAVEAGKPQPPPPARSS